MYPLSQESIVSLGNGAVAAGTGTTNGTVVNQAVSASEPGFDAVMYIVQLGTVVAGGTVTVNAQGSPNSNGSSPTTEATTGALTPAANETITLDVIRPKNQYQFPQVVIATDNVQILSIITVQYRARTLPITQPSGSNVTTAIVS
jgi:hypothetical protein